MSINGFIDKMWYIHTMKYFSVIKRNEILIRVTTSVNFSHHKSERIQAPKNICYMLLFIIGEDTN